MKKLLSTIATALCFVLMLSLVACNNGGNNEVPPIGTDGDRPNYEGTRTLVVYFSQPDNVDNSTVVINGETLGNTQYMAYVIQENTGANIFRIVPETPYPTDHSELVDLAKKEQQENARPTFSGEIEDFAQYDTVFIGYPNWWSDMPMILYTFFETYDFSGKTIIPFNTHGGSGFSNTISTIRKLEPNATVKDGKSISRNDIQNAEREIIDWVKSLGFEKPVTPDQPITTEHPETPEQPKESNILIVYFSATNNTRRIAEYIADATGGDLFELVPVNQYTSADLNYSDHSSRVYREHENENLRDITLVSYTVENWDTYDTVFIGYPIWWQIAAWPVNNFIKNNDFYNKTVIPFATSASSGLGQSGTLLAEMAGSGDWQTGMRFSSSASQSTVASWVSSLDLAKKYQGSTIPVDGEKYNTSSVYMEITITAGNNTLNAILFDNKTARAVADMLPLTISTWHPAPDFARAFDLPQSFSYFDDEPPQMSYELGSLAYWQPGPSIAMIYQASRTQTVVPVVPIGKITSNLSVLENYSGTITIAKK